MKDKEPTRLVLEDRPRTPSPQELYDELMSNYRKIMATPGAGYKSITKEDYLRRDLALVAVLYCGELRASEALRLRKKDFHQTEDCLRADNVLLSKRKKGSQKYRYVRLPLEGERAMFTELVLDYIRTLEGEDRLFPWSEETRVYHTGQYYTTKDGTRKEILSHKMIGTVRAWNVVKNLLPRITEHYLRAFGDDFLYEARNHDLIAVSEETQQSARTLEKYLKGRASKYPAA
jgi:integrase